jgi:hypothetical protein
VSSEAGGLVIPGAVEVVAEELVVTEAGELVVTEAVAGVTEAGLVMAVGSCGLAELSTEAELVTLRGTTGGLVAGVPPPEACAIGTAGTGPADTVAGDVSSAEIADDGPAVDVGGRMDAIGSS